MSVKEAIAVTVLMSLITFATRIFPFAIFKIRKPPRLLIIIEGLIPPAIMVILVIFCVRNASPTSFPYAIPEVASVLSVILLHFATKNPMISIFGGTAIYMFLHRLMGA